MAGLGHRDAAANRGAEEPEDEEKGAEHGRRPSADRRDEPCVKCGLAAGIDAQVDAPTAGSELEGLRLREAAVDRERIRRVVGDPFVARRDADILTESPDAPVERERPIGLDVHERLGRRLRPRVRLVGEREGGREEDCEREEERREGAHGEAPRGSLSEGGVRSMNH
jgi:hypothetical protein